MGDIIDVNSKIINIWIKK